MKKIFLTTGFKTVLWIAIVSVGFWGYLQFSGGGSGSGFDGSAGDSALTSEVGLASSGDTASSPSVSGGSAGFGRSARTTPASPTPSDTNNAPVLVPAGDSTDSLVSPPDDSLVTNGSASASGDPSTAKESQSSTQLQLQTCSLANVGTVTASHAVILNEIAWMGSLPQAGETAAKASNREWIELKNISKGAIDISGWQILDSAGNLKINLSNGSGTLQISSGGFYLLVRDGASLSEIPADAGYSGSLPNAGDKLVLFDPNCNASDILDASTGWPAGNNTTKQTLERDADGIGWHTSVSPGGTPRAENSVPAPLPLVASTTAPSSIISVSIVGAGTGSVSSSPTGILCGFDCQASYASGTKLIFVATPAAGSLFKGWSGACAGSAGGSAPKCSLTVSSSVAIVAEFDVIETPLVLTASSSLGGGLDDSDSGTSTISTSTTTTQASIDHLLIAAIQIGGASSSNDFVKIFNPTDAAVDLTGWKLHKKSSTGTDYSLKSFVAGNAIAPGGYFEWANSEGGFADSIGADASSTETLSADNSVALFDANGNIADQVAWGTGTDQYVEGSAYPTDPTAGQVLMRQSAGGAAGGANGTLLDTDNNASDFVIQ